MPPTEITHRGVKYYRRTYPNKAVIYFHEDLWRGFHGKFKHTVKRTRNFPYSKNLVEFLRLNPKIRLHFTEFEQHKPFVVEGNNYFANIDAYTDFCKRISSNTEGRAQAFFGQHINYDEVMSSEQRQKVLQSASGDELLKLVEGMGREDKDRLIKFLNSNKLLDDLSESPESFAKRLRTSASNSSKRVVVTAEYPKIQLETLKEHRNFLNENLKKNETFIQRWIDGKIDNKGAEISPSTEETERLKKSRCLIFGLEFVNHKREGAASQKRFDILTRVADGRNEYVLIELKSPSGSVFDVKVERNNNGGQSTTYCLSDDIARALPQIASYKGLLGEATNVEWERIGCPRGKVVKSIILVGTRPNQDPVWDDNYRHLRSGLSSSIEVMTYTDLLEKLDATIKNLAENL